MYRMRSLKYLVTTAFVTSLLTGLGYLSSFIQIGGANGYLQLTDIVTLTLITIIPGPMLLFASSIAMTLSDIIAGYFIFIPITILTRILMFIIIRCLENYFHFTITYLFALLPIVMIYPIYTWITFDKASAFKELIIDIIQVLSSYIFALFLTWFFKRISHVSDTKIWDDNNFEYLKDKQHKEMEKRD